MHRRWLLALLIAGSPVARAEARPRVTAIEVHGSASPGDRTVEQMERWFRDGCVVRQTRGPLPESGPSRIDEVGCAAAAAVAKLFEGTDRLVARPGFVRARGAAARPSTTPEGEELPDVVLVLDDGTRWRARDEETAGELERLLRDTLGEAGQSTTRSLSLTADGTALSPASRAALVIVGLGAEGRWRCGRVVAEPASAAKTKGKRPPPARPSPVAAATVAHLMDKLVEGVTPAKLLPPGDKSVATSKWGTLTVEVTLDDKSSGKLDAASAVRVAERFAPEAARLSPLCALP